MARLILYRLWLGYIGRWFWPFIGLARLNMSPEPFTSIASIILFTLGSCIVTEWFEVKNSWKKYLIVFLATINTSVCVCLSYRYMSPTFALSYLLSIVGIFCIRKEQTIIRIVIAVSCLTLSMGCYQANIGCSCLLVLLNICLILKTDSSFKKAIRFIVTSALAIMIACIAYKVSWDLVMKITGIVASSYKGANNITIRGILKSIPVTVPNTYRVFVNFFFTDIIKNNAYQRFMLYKGALCIIFCFLVIMGGIQIAKGEKKNTIIYIVSILLIPMAVNIALV